MESKLIVYTVLAITLGYVFVSTIPSQLATPQFLSVQPEEESIRSPTPEEQPAGPDETLGQSGEDVAGVISDLESSAKAADAAEESRTAASALMSYTPVFGTLFVNLTIAFAVYWLAKRRFT